MPNDYLSQTKGYLRVGSSKLPKNPKKLKHETVQGLVRGARLSESYESGGTKGLVKELERQRDEDRAKKADEGRPQFVTDANTPERLKKYVEVGMREEHLEDATKRSALHAVIQEGINRELGGVDTKQSVKDLNTKARSNLAKLPKAAFALPFYVAARILSPTKLGDGTLTGTKSRMMGHTKYTRNKDK